MHHRPLFSPRRALSLLGASLLLVVASCQTGSVSDDGGLPGSGGTSHTGGHASGGSGTGAGSGTGGTSTGGSGSGGSNGGTGGNKGTGSSSTGGANTGGSNGGTGGNKGTGSSGTGGANTGGTGGGGTGGGTGGNKATGGTNPNQPPPITNGQSGYATRYWDCCKPACGWKNAVSKGSPALSCNMSNQSVGNPDEQSVCSGGGAYTCWNEAPWSLGDTLSYGYAAVHGSAFRCGQCYQLQFDGHGKYNGKDPGSTALLGKTMIVQVLNTGNDVSQGQFDILTPGGGVGQFPQGCQKQFPGANLGASSGGMLATCGGASDTAKSCVLSACQAAFSGKGDMLTGCQWFANWFETADDPTFVYQKIACPSAITQRSGLQDPG